MAFWTTVGSVLKAIGSWLFKKVSGSQTAVHRDQGASAQASDGGKVDQTIVRTGGNVQGLTIDQRRGLTTAEVSELQAPLVGLLQQVLEQKDAGVRRVEEAGKRGEPGARQALQAIRESGDNAALLAFLLREREGLRGKSVEINREIAAVAFLQGEIDLAATAADEALRMNPEDLVSLVFKGRIHHLRGELDRSRETYERMRAIAESRQELKWIALGHRCIGLVCDVRDDLAEAERLHRQALAIDEALGNEEGMAADYGNLGNVARTHGHLAKAQGLYQQALAIHEKLDNKSGIAKGYRNLGNLACARGDLAESERLYQQALAIDEALGHKGGIAATYGNLGVVAARRRDLAGAERLQGQALVIHEELGNKECMGNGHANLGMIYFDGGDVAAARASWTRCRDLFTEIGAKEKAAWAQGLIDKYCDGAETGRESDEAPGEGPKG